MQRSCKSQSGVRLTARAPWRSNPKAEVPALNPGQCRFESDLRYQDSLSVVPRISSGETLLNEVYLVYPDVILTSSGESLLNEVYLVYHDAPQTSSGESLLSESYRVEPQTVFDYVLRI